MRWLLSIIAALALCGGFSLNAHTSDRTITTRTLPEVFQGRYVVLKRHEETARSPARGKAPSWSERDWDALPLLRDRFFLLQSRTMFLWFDGQSKLDTSPIHYGADDYYVTIFGRSSGFTHRVLWSSSDGVFVLIQRLRDANGLMLLTMVMRGKEDPLEATRVSYVLMPND